MELFNRIYYLYHGKNPLSIPPRVRDITEGATSSFELFLADFPTSIIPNIGGETTREALIYLHQLVRANTASVASNLGEGHHGHLALQIPGKEYTAQMGYTFVPPQNPGD